MALAPDSDRPTERDWTIGDYMELDDERRFEILEGELTMVPSPDIHHQRAITELGRLVGTHVREQSLGECFDAPFDVVLAEDTVVQPDFTYVSEGRLEELYDGHGLTGAPDMVVEVLSPGTEVRDRHDKRRLYAEAGVEWLLLVEPRIRVVEVLRLGDEDKYVVETTAVEDETLRFDLFPALEIELSEVWFDPPGDDENASA